MTQPVETGSASPQAAHRREDASVAASQEGHVMAEHHTPCPEAGQDPALDSSRRLVLRCGVAGTKSGGHVRAGALALGLCLLSSSIPAEEPPRTEATSQEPTPAATPAPTGLQTPRETMVVTPNRGRQTSIIDSPAAVSV